MTHNPLNPALSIMYWLLCTVFNIFHVSFI
nr:MAG TPA: Nse4 C-terminal [Caudoviricetes sp.]